MPDFPDIDKLLTERGLRLSGPSVTRDSDSNDIFAFVEIDRDDKGHQKPSNIRLNEIRDELEALDELADQKFKINYILNDISGHDLALGLRATLLNACPDQVRNAFLTIEKGNAVVWIVPKTESAREKIEEITTRVRTYLENAKVTLQDIKFTTDEKLPTRTAILNELRIASPATIEMLVERLSAKGFSIPSTDYANRHLDALRRSGQVIRRKDANYCLTADALKILGTAKQRRSPDITRLLDLARRGNVK